MYILVTNKGKKINVFALFISDGNICETPNLGYIWSETGAYLSDIEISLEMLNRYPIIRKFFLKYNTALPSSAPVERLFSFAGIINQSRRQKLSDSNFEMLVLRKANSSK